MNRFVCPIAAWTLLVASACAQAPQVPYVLEPKPEIAIHLHGAETQEQISPFLYGMFIEHGGNLINHGLWAEMLDDRKFFYPINSLSAAVPDLAAEEAQRAARMRNRQWKPIGGDEFVTMDRTDAYEGLQSPMVRLDATVPHGFMQSGLALSANKAYIGRIVVRSNGSATLKVSLVWGATSSERQDLDLPIQGDRWATLPLHFTAGVDTRNGRLEIVGNGSGSFHVGAVSLMPQDNVEGFRPEVIQLLKQLHSGMWRLPGGNYISAYDWRTAVGDRDRRPPTWDYVWGAIQPNDVGMDELMTLCRLLDVQPYITVNAGFGDDHSAAEQVEYMNGADSTPMGAWRVRNGHREPYRVKFWNVGNEPYGWWQFGHMSINFYPMKHNLFAQAMRKVDPSITIIASGAMPDEMTVLGNAAYTAGVTMAVPGTETDWTGGMLAGSMGSFDGISEHWYARVGSRFDIATPLYQRGLATPPHRWGYVPVTETQEEWIRHPSQRVREKAEEWDDYKVRFPGIEAHKLFISMDEWAYTGGPTNLRLALAYAEVLQEMFRHTDAMKMSAFTMGLSTLDYDATSAKYNTNGLMFRLYRDHFGTIPVAFDGNSPQPEPKWPIGGEQPKKNAGSPTYPLDVVASYTADRKYMTIAVVNPTDTTQKMRLTVDGMHLRGAPILWELTGPSPDATNVTGKQDEVSITEKQPADGSDLIVDPISANIFRFALQ